MSEPKSSVASPDESKEIVLGSRRSELAMIQTKHVIELMQKQYPEKKFTVEEMSTRGDRILDQPLPKIGGKGVFTEELEAELHKNYIHFVVHSLKDLPTKLDDGLVVGAVLEREDPRDALVLSEKVDAKDLAALPAKSIIGTSSLRRKAQLLSKYQHLLVNDIRGNVNTRLKKLNDDNEMYSGIILAMAGLKRMQVDPKKFTAFPGSEMMYAVGQGAMAVECCDEEKNVQFLSPLHHRETALCVVAERSFLFSLNGGCSAPVGVVSELKENGELELEGGIWSLNGKEAFIEKLSRRLENNSLGEPKKKKPHYEHYEYVVLCGIVCPSPDIDQYKVAHKLGDDLAKTLLDKYEGAQRVLKEAKKANEQSE